MKLCAELDIPLSSDGTFPNYTVHIRATLQIFYQTSKSLQPKGSKNRMQVNISPSRMLHLQWQTGIQI